MKTICLFQEEKPKKKSSRAKKEFIPPVLDDVLKFFSGSLLPDWENQGRLFFSHYNSQGWRKGTGVQVTDWDSLANKWILDEKLNEMQGVQEVRQTIQRPVTDTPGK